MKRGCLSVAYAVLSGRVSKGFAHQGFEEGLNRDVCGRERFGTSSLKTLGWEGCWLDCGARDQGGHFL